MQEAGQSRVYDPIEPYAEGELDVGHGHRIRWETSGNAHGKPAVVIHGGPGGGSNPTMRQFHDPARYRIVLFDQRGCGRSTPHASVEHNTTWDLVEDMEKLRRHLGIERWQLFGGSWGSTLALAYAQTHPGRVTGLILRGIFLLRRAELLWFYQEGASWLFPDAFAAFAAPIPAAERGDMIGAYHKRLMSPDRATALAAAKAWSIYEGSLLSLFPDPQRVERFAEAEYALAFARIECHYFVNKGFFERDDQLLRGAHRLAAIPGAIVHGRYDVVTPVKSAFDLKAVWPAADLRVVPDAGHAMSEAGTTHELVAATRRFADMA